MWVVDIFDKFVSRLGGTDGVPFRTVTSIALGLIYFCLALLAGLVVLMVAGFKLESIPIGYPIAVAVVFGTIVGIRTFITERRDWQKTHSRR